MRAILVSLSVATLVLVGSAAAVAQTATTNYPGPTTPTTVGPTSGSLSGPTLTPGQCFSAELTGYLGNITMGLTFNGIGAGSTTTGANGTATLLICQQSAGTGLGRPAAFAVVGLKLAASAPVVTIDGRSYAAQLGTNIIVATGTGSNGAARTFTVSFSIAAPSGGGSGTGLVRTGVKVLGFTIVGLGLVVVGFALVGASRRRKSPTA